MRNRRGAAIVRPRGLVRVVVVLLRILGKDAGDEARWSERIATQAVRGRTLCMRGLSNCPWLLPVVERQGGQRRQAGGAGMGLPAGRAVSRADGIARSRLAG